MGLELMFRSGLAQTAAGVIQDKAHAERLVKIGFRKDPAALRLFVPIAIDRLRLSKGFGENDLDEALLPVRNAVEAVIAAKLDLDALIEAVRKKAKER